jgi:hypothetical protein
MVGCSKLLTCLFAGLALCAGAEAQERTGCVIFDELLAAAPSGFEDLRGELIPGTSNGYVSKKMIPGMTCAISPGEASAFVCYGAPQTEDNARGAYEARISRLRTCFVGWDEAPWLDVQGPIQTADSLRLIARSDGGFLSIGAILAFEEVDGAIEWRVGFGVLSKPEDMAV